MTDAENADIWSLSKTERKRQEILRAAAAAFRRHGIDRTGTREIAREMGMTPGSLYYYFRSKPDIIAYCQETALNRLLAAGRRTLRLRAPADSRLSQLIREQIRLLLVDTHASLAHIDIDGLSSRKRARILKKRKEYESILRRVILAGVRSHVFRRLDPELHALAILGAVNWTVRWYTPEGPAGPEAIAEGFADYLVRGLMSRRRLRAAGSSRTSKLRQSEGRRS